MVGGVTWGVVTWGGVTWWGGVMWRGGVTIPTCGLRQTSANSAVGGGKNTGGVIEHSDIATPPP